MGGEVADEIEMLAKPRIGEHAPSVAAYRNTPPRSMLVAVKLEGIWLLGHAPLVDDCTGGFESIELEQAIGGREEFRRSELLFHGLVGDGDRPAGDEARRPTRPCRLLHPMVPPCRPL